MRFLKYILELERDRCIEDGLAVYDKEASNRMDNDYELAGSIHSTYDGFPFCEAEIWSLEASDISRKCRSSGWATATPKR